jgi:hypothetical protein
MKYSTPYIKSSEEIRYKSEIKPSEKSHYPSLTFF